MSVPLRRNAIVPSGAGQMNTTVLIEKVAKGRFRASTSQPIVLTGEGTSREEAIHDLQQSARKRLATAEWVQVELPATPTSNPWLQFAGIWKDHPELEAFLTDISARRRTRKS
jgi:hypothetical protein